MHVRGVDVFGAGSGLKPYFLSDSGETTGENEKVYVVSFDKILNLFPNIQEIHFLNWYTFDDEALRKLIAAIGREECRLKQVKFLYFDFKGPISAHPFFADPDSLRADLVDQLEESNWEIKHKGDHLRYSTRLCLCARCILTVYAQR